MTGFVAEQVSIELRGYNRVANKFRHIASKGADGLDDEAADFAKEQRRKLKAKPYPAKRPNQKYIRTGRLANSWRAEKRAAAQWTISNSASYAFWVVSRKGQAKVHRNRWWIFEDEMEQATPKLTKNLTNRILDEWEGA